MLFRSGPLYHALHALVLYQQRTGQNVVAEVKQPERIANAKSAVEKTNQPESKANTTTTVTESVPSPKQSEEPKKKTQPVRPRSTQPESTNEENQATQSTESKQVKTLEQVLDGAPLTGSAAKTAPTKPEFLRSTSTRTTRSEEHTSELQSRRKLVCRLLLEKKKYNDILCPDPRT